MAGYRLTCSCWYGLISELKGSPKLKRKQEKWDNESPDNDAMQRQFLSDYYVQLGSIVRKVPLPVLDHTFSALEQRQLIVTLLPALRILGLRPCQSDAPN